VLSFDVELISKRFSKEENFEKDSISIEKGISRSFIIIYVDDILIMSRDNVVIKMVKKHLNIKFDVKNLGDVKQCLDLEFVRSENAIT